MIKDSINSLIHSPRSLELTNISLRPKLLQFHMDINAIKKEIANNLIRAGSLEKQSRFFKEWRKRWVVVTSNYLFTFKNQDCREPTDVLDLKDVKSVKSLFSRSDQGNGIKITSDQISFIFRCSSVLEKWCWLVTFQRAVEFRSQGSTYFNTREMLRTVGFKSIQQFEGHVTITEFITMDSEQQKQFTKYPRKHALTQSSKKTPLLDQSPVRQVKLVNDVLKVQPLKKQYADQSVQVTEKPEISKVSSLIEPESPIKEHQNSKACDKLGQSLSKWIRHTFNQFNSGRPTQLKEIILQFIVKLVNKKQFNLNPFIIAQCKINPQKQAIADLFVILYAKNVVSENKVAEGLAFLELTLKNMADFYNFEEIKIIKKFLKNALSMLRKQQNILRLLGSIELINFLDPYIYEQSKEILKEVYHVQKSSNKPELYKEFIEQLSI